MQRLATLMSGPCQCVASLTCVVRNWNGRKPRAVDADYRSLIISMPFIEQLPIYLSGAFGGICLLILVLSVLVGYAYSERMLWWHGATLASAALALIVGQNSPGLYAAFWAVQLAFAAQALRQAAGASGAMRRPAIALRGISLVFVLLALSSLLSESLFSMLLLPWVAVTGWYLLRSWTQCRPWIYWMVLGQIALVVQWLLWASAIPGGRYISPEVGSLAALAAFAISTYIGMVWASRMRAENALRMQARERIDPLTGLAMPRVFFDRIDGALIRSRNMGYACALMLIRVENIEKIVADHQFDNSEAVVLAASRAIASTLRSQDSAARLAGNRFGVIAEGIAEGAANTLATKILAHGLRAEDWGLRGSELQFQIAVIEVSQPENSPASLLGQLEELLCQMAEQAGSSHIRTLVPLRK